MRSSSLERTDTCKPSGPLMAATFAAILFSGCSDLPDVSQPVVSAITSAGVTATVVISNQWATGYQADIHMSNSGGTTTGWSMVVNLNGTTFSGGWNAAITNGGAQLTAKNLSYNAAVPRTDTAVWGFTGSRPSGSTATPSITSLTISGGGTGTGGSGGSGGSGGATGAGGSGGTTGSGGSGGGGAGGSAAGGGGPAANISGRTCDQFGVLRDANYFVMNNVFNDAPGSQCVTGTGPGFKVDTSNHNIATNGPPASYAAFVRGCHFGTCSSTTGNIPRQVSAIASAPSSFSVITPGGNYDASYDVWFNTTMPNNGTGRNNGLELMIWLSWNGVQPIGSRTGSATIGGVSYEVWNGSASPNVITYRRSSPATSTPGGFDIKAFMSDAVGRGVLNSSWWLSSIQAGFEIWSGGVNATVSSFTATVN